MTRRLCIHICCVGSMKGELTCSAYRMAAPRNVKGREELRPCGNPNGLPSQAAPRVQGSHTHTHTQPGSRLQVCLVREDGDRDSRYGVADGEKNDERTERGKPWAMCCHK